MIVLLILSLLTCSVTFARPSYDFPVRAGSFQSYQEPQRFAGALPRAMESDYSFPEESDGQDTSMLRNEGGEGDEGEQDMQDMQDMLSPDAADTIRKINPLTIADQVSQMFRKGGRKASIVNKSGNSGGNVERGPGVEGVGGEQSQSLAQGEGEEVPVQPGYVRQVAPKIVNKPRSNDYGYSVIVLAGDAVHLPIKVQGKSQKSRGKEVQRESFSRSREDEGLQRQGQSRRGEDEEMQRQGQSRSDEEEDGGQSQRTFKSSGEEGVRRHGPSWSGAAEEEEAPKKEVRVYKQLSKRPDFPLYDADLNYVPDPLHGLLDRNYQNDMSKGERKPGSPAAVLGLENGWNGLKRRVRSDDGEGAPDNVVACGSWGKQNSTDTDPLVININVSDNNSDES